ncbi:haloacid dehalogenase type II [Streptomyces sp. NPDC101776]|uniref:haloacid dehalogenase type II n=1 Tax=Streptomyces sp. NPDC101776 TaxID=3366146 RepID=UPI003807AC81
MARSPATTEDGRRIGAGVDAVVFDVFGTVVDWRTGVASEFQRVGSRVGAQADWPGLTTQWRSLYPPTLLRVVSGEVPWRSLDELHRMTLDTVLAEHGLSGFTDTDRAELVGAWHRLSPWPDSRDGLARLRETHVTATLSNGSTALLIRLARAGGLPFDTILSAELIHSYKPDPKVYLMAAELLEVAPRRLLMTACHLDDLRAAADAGLRTAYIPRPLEWGPDHPAPPAPDWVDLIATDIPDLARQLTP